MMETKKTITRPESEIKLYFRRPWNETRGDSFDHWGTSFWYFETDKKGKIFRQIEAYENGKKLKYSLTFPADKYGQLEKRLLNLINFSTFQIKQIDFEKIWIRSE